MKERVLVIWQALGVIAAVAVLALRPPADGPMLMLPLTDAARAALVPAALARGAAIIAPGPLPGSLIVAGTRARLASAPGTLVVAAPPGGCGRGAAG